MKAKLSAWLLLTLLVAGCATVPKTVIDQVAPSAPNTAANTFAGLTVAAYPLGPELPDVQVPESDKPPVLRDKWQSRIETQVKASNKTLAPFDYRVTYGLDPNVGHPQCTVYHGDAVVASEINEIRSPHSTASRDLSSLATASSQ